MKSKYLSLAKARLPGVHLLTKVLHSSKTRSTDLLLIIRERSLVRGSAPSTNFEVRMKKKRKKKKKKR